MSKSSRIWWIAALVGVWVAAGAAWAVGTFSSSSDAAPSDVPSSEAPDLGADDRFDVITDVCEMIDWSGLEESTGVQWFEQYTDYSSLFDDTAGSETCSSFSADSALKSSLTVAVYASSAAAGAEYQNQVQSDEHTAAASMTDADPIWTTSLLTVSEGSVLEHETVVRYKFHAQSDNLFYMHTVTVANPEDPIETYLDAPITTDVLGIGQQIQDLAMAE